MSRSASCGIGMDCNDCDGCDPKITQIFKSFMMWDTTIIKAKGYTLQDDKGIWQGYNDKGVRVGWYDLNRGRGALNV